MIRTTNIELKGDKYRAEQLSLAHVNRLLTIFRRNNEFQDLLISYHEEPFFDETGRYIGVIKMQTTHGAENVIVDVPPVVVPEKGEKLELQLIKPEQTDRIVPVMRSTNNKWWVVCLSGTFEGPYYAFENIFKIAAEEMDDNVESELNNRLISIGGSPLNDTEHPQLIFVAQTGERPTELYFDVEGVGEADIGIAPGPDIATTTGEIPDPPPYLDPPIPFVYTVDVDGYKYITVWDQIISIKPRYFYGSRVQDGEINYNNSFSGTVTLTADYEFPVIVGALVLPPEIYELRADKDFWVYDSLLFTAGIRIERDDISRFACCYANYTAKATVEYDTEVDESLTESLSLPYNKIYHFQVDQITLPFYADSPTAMKYDVHPPWETQQRDSVGYGNGTGSGGEACSVERNMIKYYGTDSAAETTGIMCGRINTADINDEGMQENWETIKFLYNYIGPNYEDGMKTTTFIPENAFIHTHIIANAQNIDDTVTFSGEIFLGRIRTSTEEKVSISLNTKL